MWNKPSSEISNLRFQMPRRPGDRRGIPGHGGCGCGQIRARGAPAPLLFSEFFRNIFGPEVPVAGNCILTV